MIENPKVIVFDAFGTLVKIGTSRSPYRKLMKWLKENGRKPTSQDARIIMTCAFDIESLVEHFGYVIPSQLLTEINADLQFELDTIETLQTLKSLGFKIAICSNLAMPYGEKLKQVFPQIFDAVIFSYEVGTIKPEPRIYEIIQTKFDCEMSDILFIGDHPILDVEMPISLGMSARLIERNKNQMLNNLLNYIIK